MGEDGLAFELLLLERAEDVAVVGGGKLALAGDQRRDHLHLVLHLVEAGLGARHQLLERHVDAALAEAEAVDLLGQPEVLPRPRLHLGAQQRLVGGDLLAEAGVRLLPAGQAGLLEQLGDPRQEAGGVAELALEVALEGGEEGGLVEAVAQHGGGLVGERRRPRRQAGVLAQPHQRRRVPLLGHAVVEQGADAVEDRLRQVEDRQEDAALQLDVLGHLLRLGEHDVEVLQHRRVALGGAPALQLGGGLGDGAQELRVTVERQREDLLVEPLDAEGARLLRREARLGGEQDLGVRVAALDPSRLGGGGREGGEEGEGE